MFIVPVVRLPFYWREGIRMFWFVFVDFVKHSSNTLEYKKENKYQITVIYEIKQPTNQSKYYKDLYGGCNWNVGLVIKLNVFVLN